MPLESLTPLLYAAIIIALTYVATKIVQLLVRGIFRAEVPIVAIHTERAATVLIWLLGFLLAAEMAGLRTDLLLLLLGLAGVASIVAFKDVIQNWVSKYFSDVYVPFKVGDEIVVLGHRGKVIGINPICTVLLDRNEKTISIPNSVFVKEPMVNLTQAAWKEIIIPLVAPADIDVPEFETTVLRACHKLKKYWDERFPPLLAIKDRDRKNIRMELTLMVNAPEKKEIAASEMNRKIMEILQMVRKTKRGS